MDAIFAKIQRDSWSWRLEHFALDNPIRIFITPVMPERQYPSPYHIDCYLDEGGSYAKLLVAAADYANSGISDDDIAKVAVDIGMRLQRWSAHIALTEVLHRVPMGSKFHLDRDQDNGPGIWLSPNFELQKRYHTLSRLQGLWATRDLPPTVKLEDLGSIRRLHDSVPLVRIPTGQLAIFKGAVKVVAMMYHELRELLRMPPHQNIMAKPWYLVTRDVEGMDEPAICGFILAYHPGDTLLNAIARDGEADKISMGTKVAWVRQILDAMQHIHGPGQNYYSDLRLDNIVLREMGDLVLVDFEQYGSTERWLHPKLWKSTASEAASGDVSNSWSRSRVNPCNKVL